MRGSHRYLAGRHGLAQAVRHPVPAILAILLLLAAALSASADSNSVVRDSFNLDPANTLLSQHTLEVDAVGGGWVQGVGTDFRITHDGLAAHDAGLDTGPGIAVIDTLVNEYDLSVTVARARDHSVTGLVFRYVDTSNYFAAVHDGKSAALIKVMAGTAHVLDDRPLKPEMHDPDLWTVQVREDSVHVEINGKKELDAEDSTFADSTTAGLIFEAAHATSFRDFTVKSDEDPVEPEPAAEPAEPLVFDTFSAPDGTPLVLHEDTEVTSGGTWQTIRGGWTIESGKAVLSGVDTLQPFADQIAVIASQGPADQEISADVIWLGGTAGLVWDLSDRNNYSIAFWDGSYLVIGRVDAGVFRERGRQSANWQAGDTRNLRVQRNGDQVRVYLDDSEAVLLALGMPSPAMMNAGIFVRLDQGNSFDNFVARPSQPVAQPEGGIADGPEFPPVLTDVPDGAWLFDSFNSPDFTPLAARTPELDPAGTGWSNEAGFWQVWQAQASEQSGVFGPNGFDRFAVIDTGVDEYKLETVVEWGGGRAGVLFGGRATGPDDAGRNGFLFFHSGSLLEVGQLIGGVYFRIDATDDLNWKPGQRKTLRVEVDDGEAELKLNGREIFEFESDALAGSTWTGIFQRGSNDERFNDFTVGLPEGTEPPTPGIRPIEDVEIKAGDSIAVPIKVTGPDGFDPEISVSVVSTPEGFESGSVVSDLFNEPGDAAVPLTAHSPDLARPEAEWKQVRSGAPAFVSGRTLTLLPASDGGDQRYVIETGYRDVEVSADFIAGGGRIGLVARHDGTAVDENWVMGWIDGESPHALIGQRVNGEFRLLGITPVAWPTGVTRTLSLEVVGNSATLSVDGAEVLSAEINASLTGAHPGIFFFGAGKTGQAERFSVKGLGLPRFVTLETGGPDAPHLLIAPGQADVGRYEVDVNASDSTRSVSTAFAFTVLPGVGPIADAGGPYEADEGEAVQLDGSGTTQGNAEVVSYEWDVNGDGSPDLFVPSPLFVPTRPGVHHISLTVTDAKGLSSTASTTLTIPSDVPGVDLSALLPVGDAEITGSGVLLTPDVNWQSGAAWLPETVNVADGFTATFAVEIEPGSPPGADGFAFVLQNGPTGADAIGLPGAGLGYSLIQNSLAVEFDTWVNTAFVETDQHVAVHGIDSGSNTSSDATRVAMVDVQSLTASGTVHARVEYVPGTLRVYVEDFTTPLIEIALDIETVLDLPDGEAFIGFTASTGGASAIHRLVSFSFQS